ncbi:MAG: DUF1553 domain-containing protein, partial [Planctomycetaceae bacterium]
VFARWLTARENPFFARAAANRIWYHLFGRGIVEPVDDFRSSNPPANVELLDALAEDFETHGYDRKYIIRLICNSQTYQRSTAVNEFNAEDDTLFSRGRIRRLTAEQLHDAIGLATGALLSPEENVVRIATDRQELSVRLADLQWDDSPEDKQRQAEIARVTEELDRLVGWLDYATQRPVPERNEFLTAFGQPERETACACERLEEPTLDQALQLLNGRDVYEQVRDSVERYGPLDDDALIEELYLAAFARPPREEERQTIHAHLAEATDRDTAIRDLVWAMINTQEFLFQH